MFSIFFITFRVAIFAVSDQSRMDHDINHVQDGSKEIGVVGQVHHSSDNQLDHEGAPVPDGVLGVDDALKEATDQTEPELERVQHGLPGGGILVVVGLLLAGEAEEH